MTAPSDVVLPDNQSDFLLPILTGEDLTAINRPSDYGALGTHIGSDTQLAMERLLRKSGGRLYQEDTFRGVHHLLNLYDGPMEGIGVLEMKRLCAQLLSRARVCKWNDLTFCSRILSTVQNGIEYMDDESSTGYQEYGRFPLQTLAERKGDCECSAILVCSLLSMCGFDSGLAILLPADSESGHAIPALRRPEYRGRFAPRFYGWLNGLARSRLVPQYLFGEATSPDGGLWRPATDLQADTISYFVPLAADPMVY